METKMEEILPGPIKVPSEIAVCPICGAEITVDIDEWELADNGQWIASEAGVHSNCSAEPDISRENYDWHSWLYSHYSMPYVDWLPVDTKVNEWLNKNYRFILK